MHQEPQTANFPDDALRDGDAVLRSGQPATRRHRFPADADLHPPRQGRQGSTSAALTETLDRAERLLAVLQTEHSLVPRQPAGPSLQPHVDSQGDQALGQSGEASQTHLAAHSSSFLRDGATRSGCGLADDQQTARSREFRHDDDLSALPTRAHDFNPQSTRLVTGAATADVSTTRGELPAEDPRDAQGGTGQRTGDQAAWRSSRVTAADEKLSVAQIIRLGAAQYVAEYCDRGACYNVQSVLAKLSLCRTSVLGGHKYQCDTCEATCHVYNSCGDRHCNQCSGSKRYDFAERAGKLLLDEVDYYQVVFTLPSQLSRLALSNRESLADLLFRSAWKSLQKTIRSEQGYDPAAILVLHTWNQRLEAHWHVHALVPGSGPGVKNSGWQISEAPPESDNSDSHYLVDAINLRASFRKFAIAHLDRLRERGELKLDTDSEFGDLREVAAWNSLIEHLSSLEWVSYIQPPPSGSSGPSDLVRYLTRYLTGGPISNSRIVTADEHEVTFMAREGTKQGGESQQVPITLSTREFVRSWCLHIQPDQLTKTRYFGGWSNSQLASYQHRCAADMNAASLPYAADAMEFPPAEPENTEPRSTEPTCPRCEQATLRVVSTTPRPSWREIFSRGNESMPPWYAGSLEESDRTFWDGAHGEGFYDWYLEHAVEGAYAGVAATPAPLSCSSGQPLLPGLESGSYYAIE